MRTVDLDTLCILASLEGTRLYNYISLIIDHRIKTLCRHTEQISYLVRQRTEIPDMCYRNHQLDVSAALTAYLFLCNLNTASVTNNTFITYALVLSARTLIIAGRTEYALAEKSVTLRLVCSIIDCFRFGHLTKRILQNFFRRSKTNGDLREIILYFCIFLKSHIIYNLGCSGLIEFDT